MAVGRQDESTIVHWHPGEATGHNGLNVAQAIPGDIEADDVVVASGVYNTLEARIDAANALATLRYARLVASGILPV